MKIALELLLILAAYLLGSIPFGYIFTKKYTGKNIRDYGSGNIGSTNVKRVAGKKVALFTQLADMFKGLLPVAAVWIIGTYHLFDFHAFTIYAVALATILGHNFSIFLRFKGGKGVNTTLGASLWLAPAPVLLSVVVYYITKWSTKYVSLGSILLAVALVLSGLLISGVTYLFYYLLICSALIIVRHIPNIKRLVAGTESKAE